MHIKHRAEKLMDRLYATCSPSVIQLRSLARTLGGKVTYTPENSVLLVNVPSIPQGIAYAFGTLQDPLIENGLGYNFEPVDLECEQMGRIIYDRPDGDRSMIGDMRVFSSGIDISASVRKGKHLIPYFNKGLRKLAESKR